MSVGFELRRTRPGRATALAAQAGGALASAQDTIVPAATPAIGHSNVTSRASEQPASKPLHGVLDYLELTKPRITLMVLMTTLIGFFMATAGAIDISLLINTLIGTAMVASGASAWNQYVERDLDGLMRRTWNRPLPAGRMNPPAAHAFSVLLSLAGVVYLGGTATPLTALLAAVTVASYVFLYTPLKRRTGLAVIVGAVPGALPPVGGWAAAANDVPLEAWTLFGIVFMWQVPHFLAIAWLFRRDYERAGFPMLPARDETGRATARQIAAWSLGLVPISAAPALLQMTSSIYLAGALALGALMLGSSLAFWRSRTDAWARRLFFMSILYLPFLWALMVLNRTSH